MVMFQFLTALIGISEIATSPLHSGSISTWLNERCWLGKVTDLDKTSTNGLSHMANRPIFQAVDCIFTLTARFYPNSIPYRCPFHRMQAHGITSQSPEVSTLINFTLT